MTKMDDALKEYHNKRDFSRTGEPTGGGQAASDKPIFVIQKHDARTLHYDVRLEVDGVLKSWAVPKGPSTDPRERRLAIRTEDHPLEYAEFEGVIPEGEYGGGPIIVWDRGNYRNLRAEKEDGSRATMEQSLEQGKVEIWLEGQKLHGGYALIRTGKSEEEGWLLLKIRDDAVSVQQEPVQTEPESVLSGRTLEEIVMEGDS